MTGLRRLLLDLWHGRLPLSRAFWEFAIVYGSLLNLVTTLGTFVAFAQDQVAIGIAIHLLPVPYNFLMVLSVWRSAARYAGPAIWSSLARALVLVWAALASLI
jgi:hypothetical protein